MNVIGIKEIESTDAICCELCGKNHNIKYVVEVENEGEILYYGKVCINKILPQYYDYDKAIKDYKSEKDYKNKELVNTLNHRIDVMKKSLKMQDAGEVQLTHSEIRDTYFIIELLNKQIKTIQE